MSRLWGRARVRDSLIIQRPRTTPATGSEGASYAHINALDQKNFLFFLAATRANHALAATTNANITTAIATTPNHINHDRCLSLFISNFIFINF
jgi:hypothetical protein